LPQGLACAGATPDNMPVGKHNCVHRAGAGTADAFDVDAIVFEEPIQNTPGERAVRAAALQRQRNGLSLHAMLSSRIR